MNDNPTQNLAQDLAFEKECTRRRLAAAAFPALVAFIVPLFTALFSFLLLEFSPTWPAAFGVLALCGMATSVCFFILRQK